MAEKKEKKQKQPGKKLFNMNKVKRGGVTTLMTVVFIAIVIVLNVVVSALTQRFPSMDIDLTAEGATVKTFVIATNEELMIARDTARLVETAHLFKGAGAAEEN